MTLIALDAAPGATGTPMYIVHGVHGTITGFRALAAELGARRACYGLEARGVDGRDEPLDCVAALAAAYIDEIRAAGAPRRWLLAGWSFGGLVAYEMALQLERAGAAACAAVIDTRALLDARRDAPVDRRALAAEFGRDAAYAVHTGAGDVIARERLQATYAAHAHARLRYRPGRLRAPLAVIRAEHAGDPPADPTLGFGALATGRVHTVAVTGDHTSVLAPPHVGALAATLDAFLHACEQP